MGHGYTSTDGAKPASGSSPSTKGSPPDPIIDEERLERALTFLAESDRHYAECKAELARSEILCKRVRARIYLETPSTETVAVRNAMTETAKDVCDADEGYCRRLREFETLKAQRQRAEIVIDVWRSLEASRRKA